MPGSLRIGFDAKRAFSNKTGLGNYSRTLLKNLSLYHSEADYLLYSPKLERKDFNGFIFQDPNFQLIQPKFKNPFWRASTVRHRFVGDGIQLYHGLSHQLPKGIEHSHSKSVVTIHDLIFKRLPQTFSSIDRRLYDYKFSHAIRASDKIIAISEQTKSDILYYYPEIDQEKVEVIFQACEAVFYEEWKREYTDQIVDHLQLPEAFFLAVGSIIPRKNLLNTVRAHALLPQDLQLPIVVVGGGKSYWKQVVHESQSIGNYEKLIRLEVTDNRLLKALYIKASSVLYPSIYEGFGLPVAEAILCGTSVVTSNISSLKEVGKKEVLVDPFDIESIKEGMIYSLNRDQRQIEVSKQFMLEMLNPKKVTEQLFSLYSRLID